MNYSGIMIIFEEKNKMEEYNDDDGWLIIIGFVILVCVIIYKII
jgi:hypothetical protein